MNKRGKITLILVVKATISNAITVTVQLLVDSSTLTFARMLARMNLGRAFILAFISWEFPVLQKVLVSCLVSSVVDYEL